MKPIIKYTSLMAVALGLTSCEMKEELWSNGSGVSDKTGTLSLGVSAVEPDAVTRAVGEVSTWNFPVTITGQGDINKVVKEFPTAGQMPEKVVLPVGEYKVSAHSNLQLEKQMSEPYYSGEKTLKVEGDPVVNKETVTCTMLNSRIVVAISGEFRAAFSSWTINIHDDSDQVLAYTQEDFKDGKNEVTTYWLFGEGVEAVTVDITAKTAVGNNTVTEQSVYTKEQAAEKYDNDSDTFSGGDAIVINFAPTENTEGYITGITLAANISFTAKDEYVTVEVGDKGAGENNNGGSDTPNTPEDPNNPDAPTDPIVITDNNTGYLVNGVSYTPQPTGNTDSPYENYPTDVALHFEIANGLANLYVLVESSSKKFLTATGAMGLTTAPNGLDLTDESNSYVQQIANFQLFTMPVTDPTNGKDKVYDFSFSAGIWGLLPKYPGEHKFKLKAVDKEGNEKDGCLVVTILESN